MNRFRIWYTIEKNKNGYTVWMNKESYEKDKKGSYGSLGIYTNRFKKNCIEYCKKKGIEYEK